MSSNFDLMKLLFDPKMETILQSIKNKDKTVKEIAEELDEKPSRLYYPIQKLVSTGLIEVSEEKKKGNLIEKYYTSRHLFDDEDMMHVEGDLAIRNSDFLLSMILLSLNRGITLLKGDLDGNTNAQETEKSRAVYSEYDASLTSSEWRQVNEEIRRIIRDRDNVNNQDKTEYTFSILSYEKESKPTE